MTLARFLAFVAAVGLLVPAAGCRHKSCRDNGVSYAPVRDSDPCR